MNTMESPAPTHPSNCGGALKAMRDRWSVFAGLVGVTVLAWLYLLIDAARMQGMAMGDPAMMMGMKSWSPIDALLLFLMWSVMMVAMMVPSVTPAVLIYGTLVRRMMPGQPAGRSVALFLAGYLADWTAFSVLATALQWGLERLALLSPTMVSTSTFLGGGLLIAAGLYQWTPLKEGCLKHCKAPLFFLAQHWRSGLSGAFRMGMHHGLYCIGCCWAIMALLFVGGVMNLLWVAALSSFVLLEKLVPLGSRIGRGLSGLATIAAGIVMIVWTLAERI